MPVTVSCRVLELCRQQYYRWLAQPFTDAELDEAWLTNAIFDAHQDDPEFGYRFLADEVRAAGWDVGDRTVCRIASRNGWWCRFAKPRRNPKATAAHDDLVRRQFNADGPNQVWVTDITGHPTAEGKLYLCAIKDLWSNRIVGWAIDDRMKVRLVVAAIETAVARRADVAGCILHSDRGSQFRARKVHRALARHRMVGSMGNVAPPPTPDRSRPIDPQRIRDHHDPNGPTSCITNLSPLPAADPGELSSMTTMHSSSPGFEVVDATPVHADDTATTVQQSVDGQRVIDAPHRSGTDELYRRRARDDASGQRFNRG